MLNKKHLFIVWLFGMISGFTLMISGNTLNYWLSSRGVDIRLIGSFAIISLPYAINFIWAFIFDLVKIPYINVLLGHRLSWICMIQLLLSGAIFFLAHISIDQILFFAIACLVVSSLSSAQDTILGALRTELIPAERQHMTAGTYIFGYRIGMLLSGFGAIYLSDYISWSAIYKIFACIILLFPILLAATISNKNIKIISNKIIFTSFLKAIFRTGVNYKATLLIILLLILYRLPDDFINIMINPFLMHVGYNTKEIATTGKFFGIITSIIGGLLSGMVMHRRTIIDSMLIFGILHAFAHLFFVLQDIYGRNLLLFFLGAGFESLTGGMAMAAYLAFITSLCQGKMRAVQYSFYSSVMGLSRSIFPTISGYMVMYLGWRYFFTITTLATIPSLLLLKKLKHNE